jgi:hypothetical protein
MRWTGTVSGMSMTIFALWSSLASAQGWDRPYSPCRDGRFSTGRPMDCEAELRRLHQGLPAYDPCTDGRYSYGRPRAIAMPSCAPGTGAIGTSAPGSSLCSADRRLLREGDPQAGATGC